MAKESRHAMLSGVCIVLTSDCCHGTLFHPARTFTPVCYFKVAEHSFLVPMRYLSLFSNYWQLGSQNWQDASSTKEEYILICFIGLGTVTMATQLVVNRP